MIVKIKKVAFSCDNKRKGKHTGSLTNHILYLITDKKNKRYSDKRCNLSFGLNPNQPDLGALLAHKGASLRQSELSELVNTYCLEQHRYITQHYVKNSRKSKQLDDYQECLAPQKLFNYQGSLSFTQAEYQRLLKASGGNETQAKAMMENITRHYLASYYNQIKKEQKIKGKKTTPEEIELALNFHIKGEANPHIHFYTHAFCPTTKRYMNPRYFSETKQKVHKQIERQFNQYLEQGIATGQQKSQAKSARREYLAYLFGHSQSWFEVKRSFRELEHLINEVLNGDKPLQAKITELKKKGLSINIKPNQQLEIQQQSMPVIFTIDTFINRNLKQNLHRFAKQSHFEQQSQRYGNTTPVAKMETVLLNNLNAVNKALSQELGQIPPSQHKEAKNKAFKTFYNRCIATGVLVNLNKQHHLSFHKLDNKQVSSQNNLKATKYNASLFNSPELSGKEIAQQFDLDLDDIRQHQCELMELMPRTINYRKVVFFKMDNQQHNHVYQEYFHLNRYQSLFDYYGLEVFEEKHKTTVFNRKGESLIQIKQIDENHSRITMNTLHAPSAAKVLHSMLVREAKSLIEGQAIFIRPTKYSFGRQHLRYLHIEVMFSTDKHSQRIVVEYANMNNDKKLQRMIDEKLEQELARFAKNFVRYSQKNPDQYQFGEAVGTHLLESEHLSPEQRERVKRQIEAQKERLRSTQPLSKNTAQPTKRYRPSI
ncbi:hypothetical protein [Vibrio sp. 10N.261.46.A3]|uniref:hypothetical protein n=1 Tax=Vibrio sp. 10N.261.46.A3 TaxID=3229658 RepID=UPI00354E1A06